MTQRKKGVTQHISAMKAGTIHHHDKGSQYVSQAYTQRLQDAELLAPTGSTGHSYENALAGSINGFYKTEVIHRKSWKNHAEVELATLAWVGWYNNRWLLGRICHIPPAEAQAARLNSLQENWDGSLTACIRKLLTILNAMLTKNEAWHPLYHCMLHNEGLKTVAMFKL